MSDGLPPLALIAGPTASGKSALALALAHALTQAGRAAVIVNADASQVYRDIPILSAAPGAVERAEVPHELFGHIDGAQSCDAAQWAADARALIADAHADHAIPILVGGTGLYLRTLLDGIAPVPPVDPLVRQEVRAMTVAEAHARLTAADPAAAARFAPADTTRVQRALEVVLSSGRPIGEWQRSRIGGIGDSVALTAAVLLPPRDWLRDRCDARFDAMIAAGALDEVERLLARRLDSALPVMRAIGVPELAGHLRGTTDLATARDAATAATRQYAKRQYTWFRNQPPPHWTRQDAELNDSQLQHIATKLRDSLLTQ